jgi:hypothetical protein
MGISISLKASSTVRVVGRGFSTFGVETLLVGLEIRICSLTKNLKKERRVEIFLAMELFLFFRWRKLKYLRMANRSTFPDSISWPVERGIPKFLRKFSNSPRSLS